MVQCHSGALAEPGSRCVSDFLTTRYTESRSSGTGPASPSRFVPGSPGTTRHHKRAQALKGIERLSPIGLIFVWSISTAAWILLYGFSFDVREVALAASGEAGIRFALGGIAATLAVVPLLLLFLTFRWLESEALARRVAGWHLGQLAAAWFVGDFLAVFVYLGFADLGAGTEAFGLLYLLFFLAFSALAVPALLTAKWLTKPIETD